MTTSSRASHNAFFVALNVAGEFFAPMPLPRFLKQAQRYVPIRQGAIRLGEEHQLQALRRRPSIRDLHRPNADLQILRA